MTPEQLAKCREAFEAHIEILASAFWRRDYPNGGSLYKTYESTPYHDKELYRNEVLALGLLPTPPTQPSDGDK